MSSSWDNRVLAGTILAAGASTFAIYKYLKNKKSFPTKWRQAGVLSELSAYPIKSCGGVKLEMAECTPLGLKYGWLRDRSFMVVRDGKFISAREFHSMVLVKSKFEGDKLTLTHPNMPSIQVNMSEVVKREPETCYVWSQAVPVHDCGAEVSNWFTKLLIENDSGVKLRLVYYASDVATRPARDSTRAFKVATDADVGALPDMIAYMLMNQASVDDLNVRVGNGTVTHSQLRGNFLMINAKAYEEDNFKWVKIGSNIFEVVQPCTRCVMTTIDAETGVQNPNNEPLDTMKKYRQIEDPALRKFVGSSPVMGSFIALRSAPGVIHVNDPIYVA